MADRKIAYAATGAITFTSINSLAASSSLLAGAESNTIDNSSTLALDVLISGKVTAGSSPTAGAIEVWVVPQLEDTPTWPDVFDGTDSAESATSRDILTAGARLAWSVLTDTTSSRVYYMPPTSVAALFGGVVPKKFTLFAVHSMVAALPSSGHTFWQQAITETIA